MKKIALKVETEHDRTWTYLDRSAGRGQIGPLYRTLRWMVQQLNFEHFQVEDEENGEILSLSIGRDAVLEDATRDDVIERSKKRLQALNLSGLFAQAREKGIKPEHVGLAGKITSGVEPGAFLNTEFYYAFELIDILKRIRERSFVLESPPILGRASSWVVNLLGEATRCHLFGFNRACIALCRACMEKSLKDRVPPVELLKEKWETRGGDLECLVSAAFRLGLLDKPHYDLADQVRQRGNKMLHSKPQGKPEKGADEDSWEILCKMRAVVSFLFRGSDSTEGGS